MRKAVTSKWPSSTVSPGSSATQRVVAQLVLLELVAQQAARQARGVDGHAGELGQDVGQAADVVLVRVGDDEGLDALALVAQVGDVRHDEVDAVHLLLGEHEAAVDDDDLVGELEDGHVLADLADAAERDDPEDLRRGGGRARDGHQKSPSWSSGTGGAQGRGGRRARQAGRSPHRRAGCRRRIGGGRLGRVSRPRLAGPQERLRGWLPCRAPSSLAARPGAGPPRGGTWRSRRRPARRSPGRWPAPCRARG